MVKPWIVIAVALVGGASPAATQQSGAPGVITGGSADTMIGGKPAARQGDGTDRGGAMISGSPDVFINGKPAVVQGDRSGCGGVVVGGGGGVFINGKPVARSGDRTSGCPGR